MIPKQAIFASTFGTFDMFWCAYVCTFTQVKFEHIVFSKDLVDKLEYKPQNKIQPCFK